MVPGSYCHKTHTAQSIVHTEDEGLWDQEAGEGAVLPTVAPFGDSHYQDV